MTLTGVMALILRYLTEIGTFRGADGIEVVEDTVYRPIPKLSATEM